MSAPMDLPGEKLVIRLWETVEKAFTGWLSPWQTRRTGRAQIDVKRAERLAVAQAEQAIADIRAGRKHYTDDHRLLEGPAPTAELAARGELPWGTLVEAAQGNAILDRMRADVNVRQALLNAEEALENDQQQPPDRAVDEDWLFRWRDSAGKVSSEDLRILWGRVLAGEIKSPGTFSLRTLEFLKNVSQEEAQHIEKLAPFVINGNFVCNEGRAKETLEAEGITLGFLLMLEDLGVVSGIGGHLQHIIRSTGSKEFSVSLVAYDRALLVATDDPSKTVRLKAYAVTSLGSQVLRLGAFRAHTEYLRCVGEAIKRHGGFKVLLARACKDFCVFEPYPEPLER
ncbi:MAG: DUF2806 domain-containing protein, partial [Acidobacteria bacterium]|nr:DUF2806 domain-containing protein [Acidobacteriota bacterium]